MITKIEIDKQIKNIIFELIYQYQNEWKIIDSSNNSLEKFNKLKIPKKENYKGSCENLFYFPKEEKRIDKINNLIGADGYTNAMMYPKNSIMDWHTNSDVVGDRLYIIYTKEPGIFRYKNPKTGKIIDDFDNQGFTARVFPITKNDPLWHCVWSPGRRFSLGFNFERGYNS